MNIFKVLAKIGALAAAVIALLCIVNKKEEQKYILVYDGEANN